MFALILKGLIIGFAIAAPVGPIGTLCITRTLYHGFKIGLLIGLGAATADAMYGLIAGLGITFISNLLIEHQIWIRMIGGTYLIYLGGKTFFTKPSTDEIKTRIDDGVKAYVTTFFLTIANPATILSFIAIFASIGLDDLQGNDYIEAMILVCCIFLGSLFWWLVLSGGISMVRHKLDENIKHKINIFSGLVLILFGIMALISSFT